MRIAERLLRCCGLLRSRFPPEPFLTAHTALIRRLMRRHLNFVNKVSPKFFNGPDGGEVVRIGRDDDRLINRANERRDGPTCLTGKSPSPKWARDLVTDMSRAQYNVICVADSKIDMADRQAFWIQNMKMIDGKPEYKGAGDVIVSVIRKEGVFSLWKGFSPTYLRIGPHTVLTFIFLEQMNSAYKKYVLGDTSGRGGL